MQSDLDFLNSIQPKPQPQQQQNGTSSSPQPNGSSSGESTLPTLDASSPLAPVFNNLSLSLQSMPSAADIDSLDEAAVAELLRKMDEAEGAADGLEGRLDEMLGRLDSMLDSLGALGGDDKDDDDVEDDDDAVQDVDAIAPSEGADEPPKGQRASGP